jgi:hypothetical protein
MATPTPGLILIPDVICHILTFLGIGDRVTCRLVSHEFLACTPSPWRLAGDVLEGSNAFDVSSCCNAKLSFVSSPERPHDEAFNKARTDAIACLAKRESEYSDCKEWLWAGDAAEAANTDVSRAFSRRDPRRRPAYTDLMAQVSKRSYSLLDDWINTGPFAPPALRSPEAERLRQLLDFSKAAKERLGKSHERSMNRALDLKPGSLRMWMRPGGDGTGHYTVYEVAYKSRPCAYHFIHELASLHVATSELFQKKRKIRWGKEDVTEEEAWQTRWECYPVYQFGTDCQTRNGHVSVERGGGSSFGHELSAYLDGPFEKDSCYGGDEHFVGTSVQPCSQAHFEYLLRRPKSLTPLVAMFGEDMCDRFFDPIFPTRENAEVWETVGSIDEDFLNMAEDGGEEE